MTNELTRTEKWLQKAFELAYFIHGDAETAKHIAFNAMNKLEVASNAQYKRFYYSPDARKSRNKVSMNDLQLLQRLVYVESEAFEKEKEFTETASEKDLLVYFIKHLIRITLKRNSFYVTLGMSRILHNYATTEAMEIYNVVVQDPEKVHDDYYYRSRKGVLMKELKNRFGEKLEIAQVNRGEQRFQTAGYSDYEANLVNQCLKSFTPWNTACEFPDQFNPHFETISSLCFTGKNADDEHRIELNRMHVLLNPEMFQKVVNSLSFALPQDKLELPKFNMKKNKTNSDQNDDQSNPPSLGNDDLKELTAMLERESARRKSASSNFFRVVVDGEEKVVFDVTKQKFEQFNFDREFDELVEVYSVGNGRDTLLATYLMGGDEAFEQTSMLLENGQKISFNFNDSICKVGIEETRISRKIAIWWNSTIANFGEMKILRPALATFGLLLVCAIGLFAYLNVANQTQQIAANQRENITPIKQIETAKESAKPATTTISETKSKSTQTEKRPLLNRETIKPIEIKKAEPNKIEPKKSNNVIIFNEDTEIAEVKKFPVIESREDEIGAATNTTRSVNESGKSLKNIKYIYIEVSGDDKFGRQMGEQLMDKFNANKRFLAVNNKDKADGLLKVSVRRESDNGKDENTIVSAVVRLVNSDGFVVSPSKQKVSAWKYVGNATKIPAQVVKDLTGQK